MSSSAAAGVKRPRSPANDADDNSWTPLGTFTGKSIFRNRLHESEMFEDGHVSIHNLVPPECESALFTTFAASGPAWFESIFHGIKDVLVVTHDAREHKARLVGNAELCPMKTSSSWYWILAKPHTGGCLHAKLLLFRSKKGLRVVVSGSNLFQDQWERDRDCLWVQDFMTTNSVLDCEFSSRLHSFLRSITACQDVKDERLVQSRLNQLLAGVDMSTAAARLVYSFPRPTGSKADRGGYKQLAAAVRQSLVELDTGYDTDDDDDDSGSIVYAMAGSFGNLAPDFLLQMYEALLGGERTASKNTRWEQLFGRVKCLWPSRETALDNMDLVSLIGSMRPMPRSYWDKIPSEIKRRLFFDAPPNPRHPNGGLSAFSHAKVLYCTNKSYSAVLYVGSHNFSKAAWGLRDASPKNVEIGVVLATTCPKSREEWQHRLPALLPSPTAVSPATYIPASAHDGCRLVFEQGRPDEALQMLREWLQQDATTSPAKAEVKQDASSANADVIDLCDSD